MTAVRTVLAILLASAVAACSPSAGGGDRATPPAGSAAQDAAAPAPGPEPPPTAALRSEVSFDHAGHTVPATLIRPPRTAAGGRVPLVVVVHGRAGMPLYRDRLVGLGERLAGAGMAALVPDYFAATGDTAPAPIDETRFETWRGALGAAIGLAGGLDGIDPDRIGVAGFSLGSYLALLEAADDPRLGAVAANYTGLPDSFPARPAEFPPLLVIHAEDDPLAPVAGARALAERVRGAGGRVEVVVYPADTHVLEGEDWDDAAGRMVAFFAAELQPR